MVELRGGHPAQPLTIEGLRLTDERIDQIKTQLYFAIGIAVHELHDEIGLRDLDTEFLAQLALQSLFR